MPNCAAAYVAAAGLGLLSSLALESAARLLTVALLLLAAAALLSLGSFYHKVIFALTFALM